MLRRSICRRTIFKPTITLRQRSDEERSAELQREALLRSRVVPLSASTAFPQMDHSVYASYETAPKTFNSGGAGLNNNNNNNNNNGNDGGATQQDGNSQQQLPQFPFPFRFLNGTVPPGQSNAIPNPFASMFGRGNNNNNNNNGNNNGNGNNNKAAPTDYFMFFTGLALMLYSLRLLTKGTTADSAADGTLIPMWALTPPLKAKYIVFNAVTTIAERDALRAEYEGVAKATPFLTFFDWLEMRYPNWAAGYRYPQQVVFDTIATAVGPTGDATKIPRLILNIMQKKGGASLLGISIAGSEANTDRPILIDEMVDTINSAFSFGGGGGGAGMPFAPFGGGGGNGGFGFLPPPAAPPMFGAYPPSALPLHHQQQQPAYYPPAPTYPPSAAAYGALPPSFYPPTQQQLPPQQQHFSAPPSGLASTGGVGGFGGPAAASAAHPSAHHAVPSPAASSAALTTAITSHAGSANNNNNNTAVGSSSLSSAAAGSAFIGGGGGGGGGAMGGGEAYFQQPRPLDLRGTQDISLKDITGVDAVVPQHHYVPTSDNKKDNK